MATRMLIGIIIVGLIILSPIIVVIIDEVWDWIDKKYKKKR